MDTSPQFGVSRRPKRKAVSVRTSERLFSYRELSEKGINYSMAHIHSMMKKGTFPKAIRLTPHKFVWSESAIDSWIADKIAKSAA